ncbi:MAG: hypothetical protein WBM07_14290 [Chitinivibrionales bacterium]
MLNRVGNIFESCNPLLYGIVLFGIHVSAFSAQEISFSGEQDGYFEEGQYLATSTITVRRGKTLSFAPGCVIRFKQYTGITVEGELKCLGGTSEPVVFTSDNDRPAKDKAPAPFDWNGIKVADSEASVFFENVRIAFSTYGLDIKSPSSKINLKGVVFSENGRSGITVDDEQLGVIDNEQFSFVQPRPGNEAPSVRNEPAAGPNDKKPPPKKTGLKMPVRLSLGAVGVAGLAFGVYENMQAEKYFNRSQNESLPYSDNDLNKNGTAVNLRNIGYGIAIAAACGFTLTFFF